ncbi:acyltransferase family protein [Collimonas pratensis]|uniref:Acyltransferase family protein n=2 Tax=Collimonas pratensis TaxID=279113 RepID=A0ABN4M3V1_9BURK|nr:acyltransferase family protein [Collimonas pratensis]
MTLNFHFTRLFFPWDMFHPYRNDSTPINILNNSWTGVDLFLVISGFIISKTIVKNLDQLRDFNLSQASFVKAFYARRIFRIYPVAWVVFFAVVIISAVSNQGGYFASLTNNIEAGISIFTYTYNYFAVKMCLNHTCALAPYWSLSLEEQFYLLLPLFLLLTRSTRQRVWILCGLLMVITFVVRPLLHDDILIFYMQNRADGLLYGCLIYFLTEQPWFKAIRISTMQNRTMASLLTLILVFVLTGIPGVGFSTSLTIPIACLLASVLVILASFEAGVICFPKPVEGFLNYLGSRSYSLYLAHMPMLTLTQEIMFRYAANAHEPLGPQLLPYYLVISLSLAFAATELIYRTVEQPMLAKGKRISEQILNKNGSPPPRPVEEQASQNLTINPRVVAE